MSPLEILTIGLIISVEKTNYLMIMKKLFLFFILSIVSVPVFAQVDRSNNWLARVNYNQNFLTMGYTNDTKHWSIGGVSMDFGGKQFFKNDNGWFIEESAEFFFTDLPVSKKVSGPDKWCRELGVGAVLLSGFDFNLNNDMSLEVFGGVVYRRLLYNKEKYGTVDNDGSAIKRIRKNIDIYDNNLRLIFGAGLNYNRYNFRFTLSHDLLNRTINDWYGGRSGYKQHYTTLQVGFGVGLYF